MYIHIYSSTKIHITWRNDWILGKCMSSRWKDTRALSPYMFTYACKYMYMCILTKIHITWRNGWARVGQVVEGRLATSARHWGWIRYPTLPPTCDHVWYPNTACALTHILARAFSSLTLLSLSSLSPLSSFLSLFSLQSLSLSSFSPISHPTRCSPLLPCSHLSFSTRLALPPSLPPFLSLDSTIPFLSLSAHSWDAATQQCAAVRRPPHMGPHFSKVCVPFVCPILSRICPY